MSVHAHTNTQRSRGFRVIKHGTTELSFMNPGSYILSPVGDISKAASDIPAPAPPPPPPAPAASIAAAPPAPTASRSQAPLPAVPSPISAATPPKVWTAQNVCTYPPNHAYTHSHTQSAYMLTRYRRANKYRVHTLNAQNVCTYPPNHAYTHSHTQSAYMLTRFRRTSKHRVHTLKLTRLRTSTHKHSCKHKYAYMDIYTQGAAATPIAAAAGGAPVTPSMPMPVPEASRLPAANKVTVQLCQQKWAQLAMGTCNGKKLE